MSEYIDNRAQRVRTLKDVITRLHRGEAPAQVKPVLTALVRECSPSDVAAMEQELMADGMPVSEVMSMCDLHAEVLRDIVVAPARLVPPGHPVDTFRRENEALREHCARLRALAALALSGTGDTPVDPARHDAFLRAFNELMDVDKHYRRKEELLFPFLERAGITGPSKVMWGKDDEIRALLKDLGDAVRERDVRVAEWRLLTQTVIAAAIGAVEEMILKEEKVLLPMALDALTDLDWAQIHAQSPAIGWCLVEPRGGWPPAGLPEPAEAGSTHGAGIVLPSGAVSPSSLAAIFAVLPFDLTFVDADDRVAFFTEGPARVFHRAKAVIGRKVQHCHPPSSVDVVQRILDDFRGGRQDVASFWIDFRGRFVQIRYFAVRDEQRQYLGTLEVTQDLTDARALTGERRLLQYD